MKNSTKAAIFYIVATVGLIETIIYPDISDKIIVSTTTICAAIIAATCDIKKD